MTFIDTAPAEGVPNYERAFSQRPAVYAAWQQLNGAIKAEMEPRRYELATLAAARRLRSSYCALAHGSVLLDGGMVDAAQLTAIVRDHHDAGLDAADVAIMDLAAKVADDATSVTQEDVDGLHALGLSDAEVFDVVAAAAARCFFSSVLDGVGAHADARYAAIEPAQLRDELTVGRPISAA